MGSPFDSLKKMVKTAVHTVETTAQNAVQTVEKKATDVVHTAQTTVNQARQTVQHTVDAFEHTVASTVQSAQQKATQVVQTAQDNVARVVNNVERKVNTAERTISSTAQNLQQKLKDATETVKPMVKEMVGFAQATADSLEQAVGLKPTPNEPPVMHGDAGSVTYGPAQGQTFVDGVKPQDIKQGGTGDCYFLSSMASLAQNHPDLIQNNIKPNPDGTYTVTFHVPPGFDVLKALGPAGGIAEEKLLDTANTLANTFGVNVPMQTVQVTVDGDLPHNDQSGNLQYANTPNNELWPAVMEKAYAKLWGNYGAVGSGGDPAAAMRALTGGAVTHYGLDSSSLEPLIGVNLKTNPNSAAQLDSIYDNVKAATDGQKMVVATTYGANPAQPLNGIVGAHAYTVMGVQEENGQKYVVLRNPWGYQEPGNDGNNDGVFRLTVDQFAQQFSGYDVGEVP